MRTNTISSQFIYIKVGYLGVIISILVEFWTIDTWTNMAYQYVCERTSKKSSPDSEYTASWNELNYPYMISNPLWPFDLGLE